MKRNAIVFIIPLFLTIVFCKQQSDIAKTSNFKCDKVVKNYEYNHNNIKDIEKMIRILVNEKRCADGSNEKIFGNITAGVIKDLEKLQKKGTDKRILVKNYLILYQYIEVYNEEILNEIVRNIFINNPDIVLECLVGINSYLLEEFRNEEFLRELYKTVCDIPNKYYEENKEKKIRKIIVKKLLAIRRSKNSNIIDYIIKENFSDI